MKKIMAYGRQKTLSKLYLVVCLILFNALFVLSCGLETFYQINAPTAKTLPSVDSAFEKMDFVFNTNEDGNSSGLKYNGTEVYYKIYDDKTECSDAVNALSEAATKNASNALEMLRGLESSGYKGFQKLRMKERPNDVLIPYTGNNREITIRLSDYQDDVFTSKVLVGDTFVGTPTRYNSKQTFNFGRDKGKNAPNTTVQEVDVKLKSPTDNDHTWYIPLFAVNEGFDTNYTLYFSNITYLGSVTIRDNQEDN